MERPCKYQQYHIHKVKTSLKTGIFLPQIWLKKKQPLTFLAVIIKKHNRKIEPSWRFGFSGDVFDKGAEICMCWYCVTCIYLCIYLYLFVCLSTCQLSSFSSLLSSKPVCTSESLTMQVCVFIHMHVHCAIEQKPNRLDPGHQFLLPGYSLTSCFLRCCLYVFLFWRFLHHQVQTLDFTGFGIKL